MDSLSLLPLHRDMVSSPGVPCLLSKSLKSQLFISWVITGTHFAQPSGKGLPVSLEDPVSGVGLNALCALEIMNHCDGTRVL